MQKKVTEFKKYRSEMNDKILNSGFRDFNKFFALDNKAYIDGALDSKTKELMGLVASMVLRCNDCILYHIDRAVEEGATRQEFYESFNISLIVGGSIVIPHLRFAMEQLDDLLEDQNEKTDNT
jgi:AhpD family alkylhydroperoxidase